MNIALFFRRVFFVIILATFLFVVLKFIMCASRKVRPKGVNV